MAPCFLCFQKGNVFDFSGLHRPKGGKLGGFAVGWCGDGRVSGRETRPLREDGRVMRMREGFGTGDPSPTRGREVGRIRRKVEQAGEMLLHTSSVKNQIDFCQLPLKGKPWALPRRCDGTIE